jgi:fluoroquinolone transport system permease protein
MLKLLKYDFNIQLRSGYWTVYGVIALIYILILFNLPMSIRDDAAILLIFMDTSSLGVIFVGALVLLEKQQGVLQSLSVTPLKLVKYLFSKVLTLTLLSAVVSSLLWILPQWTLKGYAMLLSGVVMSSMALTMFGIGFTAGASSFNQFLARVFVGSLIFSIPVIPMFFYPQTGWLIFLPMNAAMDIFIRLTKGIFSFMQIIDLGILTIWIFLMTMFAEKQFRRNNLFILN